MLLGQIFCPWGNYMDLLFLRLALIRFSGIITTILGKTATNTKDAGRDTRVHHSKSLPLPLNGERLFFSLKYHQKKMIKFLIKHIDMAYYAGSSALIPHAEVSLIFSKSQLRNGSL